MFRSIFSLFVIFSYLKEILVLVQTSAVSTNQQSSCPSSDGRGEVRRLSVTGSELFGLANSLIQLVNIIPDVEQNFDANPVKVLVGEMIESMGDGLDSSAFATEAVLSPVATALKNVGVELKGLKVLQDAASRTKVENSLKALGGAVTTFIGVAGNGLTSGDPIKAVLTEIGALLTSHHANLLITDERSKLVRLLQKLVVLMLRKADNCDQPSSTLEDIAVELIGLSQLLGETVVNLEKAKQIATKCHILIRKMISLSHLTDAITSEGIGFRKSLKDIDTWLTTNVVGASGSTVTYDPLKTSVKNFASKFRHILSFPGFEGNKQASSAVSDVVNILSRSETDSKNVFADPNERKALGSKFESLFSAILNSVYENRGRIPRGCLSKTRVKKLLSDNCKSNVITPFVFRQGMWAINQLESSPDYVVQSDYFLSGLLPVRFFSYVAGIVQKSSETVNCQSFIQLLESSNDVICYFEKKGSLAELFHDDKSLCVQNAQQQAK